MSKKDVHAKEAPTTHDATKNYKIVIGILALLLAFMFVWAVVATAKAYDSSKELHRSKQAMSSRMHNLEKNKRYSMRDRMFTGGAFMGGENSNTRVTGTVAAVNDTSLTVAGNGTKKVVTLNGATKYLNDTKPKVNDSILAIGSTSGETFTASSVRVTNTNR